MKKCSPKEITIMIKSMLPCKGCITFPMCFSKIQGCSDLIKIYHLRNTCSIFNTFYVHISRVASHRLYDKRNLEFLKLFKQD